MIRKSSGKKAPHANEKDIQFLGRKFPLLTIYGPGLMFIPVAPFCLSLVNPCDLPLVNKLEGGRGDDEGAQTW